MKKMTLHLKYFSCLTALFSVAFFSYLYTALQAQSYNQIWLYAILFGTMLFISGLTLGYKDSVRDSRIDLGFHYHLMTFILVNTIGGLMWIIEFGFASAWQILLNACLWGIGLGVHYFFSLRSIKGMDREEIFV